MNCEEVQEQLSDLLDKSLEIERSQEIQEHLVACSVCSAEMASLAEYQQLMSNLPVIEPPAGFTARVMAEVRETAHPPTLWERLFLPLRIRIPLQATAVVLIAALAAYIYQKEPLQRESGVSFPQPESSFKKQVETDNLTPSGTPPAKAKQAAEENEAHVQEFKDSAQLKKRQSPPPKPEEQHKPIGGDQFAAPGAAHSQDQIRTPVTLSPTPLQGNSSAANEAAAPRREQSSLPGSASAENSSPDAQEKRRAASSLDALRSGVITSIAPTADHEVMIRLKEPARDDKIAEDRLAAEHAQPKRQLSTSQGEARTLVDQARERAIQTGRAQTVWLDIGRNEYELFKKELANLGNIELETPTAAHENDAVDKSSDQLRIKVTMLPPLPAGNPVPSQPSGR